MTTKKRPRYRIEFLAAANKHLADIAPVHRRRIASKIDALAGNPRPAGAKKLQSNGYLRIRIGRYRVIYEIEDGRLVVLIVSVGHRREVYR